MSSLSHRDGLTVRIDLVSKRVTASKADEHCPLKEANWISFVCTERVIGLLSFNLAEDNQTKIAEWPLKREQIVPSWCKIKYKFYKKDLNNMCDQKQR